MLYLTGSTAVGGEVPNGRRNRNLRADARDALPHPAPPAASSPFLAPLLSITPPSIRCSDRRRRRPSPSPRRVITLPRAAANTTSPRQARPPNRTVNAISLCKHDVHLPRSSHLPSTPFSRGTTNATLTAWHLARHLASPASVHNYAAHYAAATVLCQPPHRTMPHASIAGKDDLLGGGVLPAARRRAVADEEVARCGGNSGRNSSDGGVSS